MFRLGYKIAIRTGLKALCGMALRNLEGPISLGWKSCGQLCELHHALGLDRTSPLVRDCGPNSSARLDRLFDGTKQAVAFGIPHLDTDDIAIFQKGRGGLAIGQGLHRSHLRDTGIANAASL